MRVQVRRLGRLILLKELREYKETDLKGMPLLSREKSFQVIQPVSARHWDFIMGLEDNVNATDL